MRGAQLALKCIAAVDLYKQEGHAVAGNYRAMRDTCTESLQLILGQRSE